MKNTKIWIKSDKRMQISILLFMLVYYKIKRYNKAQADMCQTQTVSKLNRSLCGGV